MSVAGVRVETSTGIILLMLFNGSFLALLFLKTVPILSLVSGLLIWISVRHLGVLVVQNALPNVGCGVRLATARIEHHNSLVLEHDHSFAGCIDDGVACTPLGPACIDSSYDIRMIFPAHRIKVKVGNSFPSRC